MDLYPIILKLFSLFYCTFSLTEENLFRVNATPLIIRLITIFLNIVLSFLLNMSIMHISFFLQEVHQPITLVLHELVRLATPSHHAKCENHNMGSPSQRLMHIYI